MVATPVQKPTADSLARDYIQAMLRQEKPSERPDVGKWAHCCGVLEESYEDAPESIATVLKALIGSKKYPGLRELVYGSEEGKGAALQGASGDEGEGGRMPALPQEAVLPEGLAVGASPCLEMYVPYSKKVSPEGYAFFHENCFLWALSVVAARRVKIPLGEDYTPLMLAMVGTSGLYKKTTTAKAAMKWLHESGLGFLLGAKRTTPQKLIYDMAGVLPKNYSELDREKQERVEKRLAFSGQRGWYNDELGKFIKGTQNENSVMADFQQLLLEMDNCDLVFDNSTIARGTEIIEKPYLALLGSMTPANITKNAKRGSEFWSDGFWARFVFVCPPLGTSMDEPFELGDVPVPGLLVQRLYEWHVRLGVPVARVEPVIENEKDTGRLNIRRDDLPEVECRLGTGVYEAWRRYRSGLKHIMTEWSQTDLNGNYERLPTKAMRVAALIASLENNGLIEMRHWALAQEIAERWRQSLHELYAQVNINKELSATATMEDEIVRHVYRLESDKHIHPTAADLRNYMKQYAVSRIQEACDDLVAVGILAVEKTAHAKRYHLIPVG